MDNATRILHWVSQDALRMSALEQAQELSLSDWCLAAGFVRNMVWDILHEYSDSTPLNDIDLIHFDLSDISQQRDQKIERHLRSKSDAQWSVKNQARMHIRNGHRPYLSTCDAMSFWPEIETAVGVTMTSDGQLQLLAPLGVDTLLESKLTPNDRCTDPGLFSRRLARKQWLTLWPKLQLHKA